MKVVDIVTEQFQARALHFSELPAAQMLPLMNPRLGEYEQAMNLLTVVKAALLDPAKATEFDALSLADMQAVLEQFISAKPTTYDWEEQP